MPRGLPDSKLQHKLLHDPVLPLNLESDVPGGIAVMAKALLDLLSPLPGIDVSNLAKAVQ